MDAIYATRAHFPARREAFLRFASIMRNPGTLGLYWTAVRFAENLLQLDHEVPATITGQVGRGVRSGHLPAARPRFLRADVLRLIRCAVEHRDLTSARLYAIARAWLSRVANELFALQRNGREGLRSSDSGWHSVVTVS